MSTGYSSSGYCFECKTDLDSNCSLDEHRSSRKHINKLLRAGIPVPLDSLKATREDTIHADNPSKPAFCVVCRQPVGSWVQAVAHYRSREHLNARLKKGLPLPQASDQSDQCIDRNYLNNCLRNGVMLQQPSTIKTGTNQSRPYDTSLASTPKLNVTACKRKLPMLSSPVDVHDVAGNYLETELQCPMPSFVQKKRLRLPTAGTSKSKSILSYVPRAGSVGSNRQSYSSTRMQSADYGAGSRSHSSNFQWQEDYSNNADYHWFCENCGAGFYNEHYVHAHQRYCNFGSATFSPQYV